MKTALIRLMLVVIPACLGFRAYGETVYVDANNGSVGTGTKESPYQTINQALANPSSDTIMVMPGVYQEQLRIRRSVRIIGYDGPNTTVIDGSPLAPETVMVLPDVGLSVVMEGLKISGGRYGVFQGTKGSMTLRNVIVCDAREHGVAVSRDLETSDDEASRLTMISCLVFGTALEGVVIHQASSTYPPRVTLLNCLFAGNKRAAVWAGAQAIEQVPPRSFFQVDHNAFFGNASEEGGSFGGWVGKGPNSISADPQFVGGPGPRSSKDFRLLPNSPLRDAGHPALGYSDPDGTRNDIGAFGGPWARTFYTSPNDGPMVREVTVDKGIVPKGETFTIRAKAAVR